MRWFWVSGCLGILALAGVLRAESRAADGFVPFVIPFEISERSLIARRNAPIPPDASRIVIRDGHFYSADGRRYRVWGVNFAFGACFPSEEDAAKLARRLEAFGVNSVRIHHVDMFPYPDGIWDRQHPTELSAEALDRLDGLIHHLAQRGITINLNLHVSRTHSNFLDLPSSKSIGNYNKMVDLFTPQLVEAQKKYARDLLGHVNRHRQVSYAKDPAIAFIEINNENSLFLWNWQANLRNMPPFYAQILRQRFGQWLLERYGTREKLAAAWSPDANHEPAAQGLGEDEDPAAASVKLGLERVTTRRWHDQLRFLAEVEKAYWREMYDLIRDELGCEALVTGTMVFGPVGIWTHSEMDFIDGHAYWAHPRFPPGKAFNSPDWTITPAAMVDTIVKNKLIELASSRVAGRPFTVSEYNHAAPNDFQAECIPMIAATAAAQDWDGVWIYCYSQRRGDWDAGYFKNYFEIDQNPSKWAFMPAGAAIFRDAAIAPLPTGTIYPLSEPADVDDPLEGLIRLHRKYGMSMFNAVADRSQLGFDSLSLGRIAVHPLHAKIPLPFVESQTMLRWITGDYQTIGEQAAVFVHTRQPTECSLLRHPEDDFVVLTVVAMDVRPLQQSERVLLTVSGRCENTGMQYSADRRTVGNRWGQAPVRVQLPAVQLQWSAVGPVTLTPLKPDGSPADPIRLTPTADGSLTLHLGPPHQTMWYVLERDSEAATRPAEQKTGGDGQEAQ